jgi:hypothetical protein
MFRIPPVETTHAICLEEKKVQRMKCCCMANFVASSGMANFVASSGKGSITLSEKTKRRVLDAIKRIRAEVVLTRGTQDLTESTLCMIADYFDVVQAGADQKCPDSGWELGMTV